MESSTDYPAPIDPKYADRIEYFRFKDRTGAYFLRRSNIQISLLQHYFTEAFTDEEIIELYPDLDVGDLDVARDFIVDVLG